MQRDVRVKGIQKLADRSGKIRRKGGHVDRFVVEQPVLLAPLRELEDLRSVFGRVSGIRLNTL